ncbi:MAG: hypothetical protein HUU20_27580, partial [Pirellulales bacterium]|nr:hypothetical protein [Pirellulales bacterium]
LNTRWLAHIVRHRQALGLEAVRINFAPTQHDPLAQLAGPFTLHFTADRRIWECYGERETGASVFTLPAVEDEICRSGLQSDRPLQWVLQPILARGNSPKPEPALLPAGKYRLRLYLIDPASTAAGQRVFSVSVDGAVVADRVDIFAESGGAGRPVNRVWPVTLDRPGSIAVTLTPVEGKAVVCGAELEPVESNSVAPSVVPRSAR